MAVLKIKWHQISILWFDTTANKSQSISEIRHNDCHKEYNIEKQFLSTLRHMLCTVDEDRYWTISSCQFVSTLQVNKHQVQVTDDHFLCHSQAVSLAYVSIHLWNSKLTASSFQCPGERANLSAYPLMVQIKLLIAFTMCSWIGNTSVLNTNSYWLKMHPKKRDIFQVFFFF